MSRPTYQTTRSTSNEDLNIEEELANMDIKLGLGLGRPTSYSHDDISLQTKSLDFEVSHPIIRERSTVHIKPILKCTTTKPIGSSSDTESDAHLDPVTKQILLPSVSTWGKAPKQLFGDTAPWEVFGVELDTMSVPAIIEKLSEAARSCGLSKIKASLAKRQRKMISLLFSHLLEDDAECWDLKSQEAPYEYLLEMQRFLKQPLFTDEAGMIYQDHIEQIIDMLVDLQFQYGERKGAGMARTSTVEVLHSILVFIFKTRAKKEVKIEGYLYPQHENYMKTKVKAISDFEVQAHITKGLSRKSVCSLLVGEVKKEHRPQKISGIPDMLKDCYPAIYQHFGELILSIRGSIFSQNWKDVPEGDCSGKTSHCSMNYMFGFMTHGCQMQFTCLQMDQKLMSRVVKKRTSFLIDTNSAESVASDELSDNEKTGGKEENESEDCACASSGKLFVSPKLSLIDMRQLKEILDILCYFNRFTKVEM